MHETDASNEPGSATPESREPIQADGGADTPLISIDDFAKIELRVAEIREAERHPNADRLLKLQVDLGGERRQIVAGIAGAYTPEELVGRQIVIVANLKPTTLRGEVSQGMLLAASDEVTLSLLGPHREVALGSKVR